MQHRPSESRTRRNVADIRVGVWAADKSVNSKSVSVSPGESQRAAIHGPAPPALARQTTVMAVRVMAVESAAILPGIFQPSVERRCRGMLMAKKIMMTIKSCVAMVESGRVSGIFSKEGAIATMTTFKHCPPK